MRILCFVWVVGTVAGCMSEVAGVSPDDGSGGASCSDTCQEGAGQCSSGDAFQTCAKSAKGCLEWQAPIACLAGQVCALGSCIDPTASCAVIKQLDPTAPDGIYTRTSDMAKIYCDMT